MEKFINKKHLSFKQIILKYFFECLLPIAAFFLWHHLIRVISAHIDYYTVTHGYWLIDMHTIFDDWIPRMDAGWLVIYISAIFSWIVFPFFIYALCGKKTFYTFILVGFFIYLVAFVIWVIFPVYAYMRNPDEHSYNYISFNAFPSAHVFNSWLIFIALRQPCEQKETKVKKYFHYGFAWFNLIWTLAVIVSTWFVKQHFFVDFIPAIFLAEGCYFLVKYYLKKHNNFLIPFFVSINGILLIEQIPSNYKFANNFVKHTERSGSKKSILILLWFFYIVIVFWCIFSFIFN